MNNKYYTTLGLKPGATEDEIKKAWKKMAMDWHPDRNPSEEAKTKIQEINEAYEILMGKKQPPREEQQQHFHNPFADRFRNSGFRMKARPMNLVLDLTVEEVFNGTTKKINYHVDRSCGTCNGVGGKTGVCPSCKGQGVFVENRHGMQAFNICGNCNGAGQVRVESCKSCHGRGLNLTVESIDVKISRGVTEGYKIVITNAGNDSMGNTRGDIYLTMRVIPHTKYQLEGLNINKNEELPFIDMILGKEVEIETLGGKFKITIPSNCEANKVFRMKGQGLTDDDTGVIGDLYLKIVPKIPKYISNEEKDILLKLRETTNFS